MLSSLSPQARLAQEPALAHWELCPPNASTPCYHLHRELVFSDFNAALAYMVAAGGLAEKQAHHPNWANVYNRLSISLYTHEAQGLTEKDWALALAFEALVPVV
jgi:4a-hydroxytetrahydrobiopterin dehydratase